MKVCVIATFLFLSLSLSLSAQTSDDNAQHIDYSSRDEQKVRIAVLMGHTVLPTGVSGEDFYIPSWGLDLEYWTSNELGAGLHCDIELETFLVVGEGNSENHLERHYPIVMSLDLLYKPWENLVFQIGPGIEIEKNENLRLFRIGLEYEIEIGKHFDLAPTVFYDNRFNNYNTWTIAIGIGKSF